MAAIKRRVSVPVNIEGVWVGGNHPIVVQSMTNTDTADMVSNFNQVIRAGAGRLGVSLLAWFQKVI